MMGISNNNLSTEQPFSLHQENRGMRLSDDYSKLIGPNILGISIIRSELI